MWIVLLRRLLKLPKQVKIVVPWRYGAAVQHAALSRRKHGFESR